MRYSSADRNVQLMPVRSRIGWDGRALGLARTGDAAFVIGVDVDEWVSTFDSGKVRSGVQSCP